MSPRSRKSRPASVSPNEYGALPPDEMFLQPWFIPKETYSQIRSLLPSIHLSKMRYYFEDFGCLRCGKTDVCYGSNGFCEACSVLVRGRVVRSLQRRLKRAGVPHEVKPISVFTDRMIEAQRLLQKVFPKQEFRNKRAK